MAAFPGLPASRGEDQATPGNLWVSHRAGGDTLALPPPLPAHAPPTPSPEQDDWAGWGEEGTGRALREKAKGDSPPPKPYGPEKTWSHNACTPEASARSWQCPETLAPRPASPKPKSRGHYPPSANRIGGGRSHSCVPRPPSSPPAVRRLAGCRGRQSH